MAIRKMIDLGWCLARLEPDKLTIVSQSEHGETAYNPAESIVIYGSANLKALRDELLAEFPI